MSLTEERYYTNMSRLINQGFHAHENYFKKILASPFQVSFHFLPVAYQAAMKPNFGEI